MLNNEDSMNYENYSLDRQPMSDKHFALLMAVKNASVSNRSSATISILRDANDFLSWLARN